MSNPREAVATPLARITDSVTGGRATTHSRIAAVQGRAGSWGCSPGRPASVRARFSESSTGRPVRRHRRLFCRRGLGNPTRKRSQHQCDHRKDAPNHRKAINDPVHQVRSISKIIVVTARAIDTQPCQTRILSARERARGRSDSPFRAWPKGIISSTYERSAQTGRACVSWDSLSALICVALKQEFSCLSSPWPFYANDRDEKA